MTDFVEIAVGFERCLREGLNIDLIKEMGFGPIYGPNRRSVNNVVRGVYVESMAAHTRSQVVLHLDLSALTTPAKTGPTLSCLAILSDKSQSTDIFMEYVMKRAQIPPHNRISHEPFTVETYSQLIESLNEQIVFIRDHLPDVVEGARWIDDAQPTW